MSKITGGLRSPVAWIALFVALGGSAYAGSQLPRGSVGTKQLRAAAVTNAKIREGSVEATALSPVARAALVAPSATTLRTNASPVGVCGAMSCSYPPGQTVTARAPCIEGERAIAGGYTLDPNEAAVAQVTASRPSADERAWEVTATIVAATDHLPALAVNVVCRPVS